MKNLVILKKKLFLALLILNKIKISIEEINNRIIKLIFQLIDENQDGKYQK